MKIRFFLYFFISILIIGSTAIIYRYIALEKLKTNVYKTEAIKASNQSNVIITSGILESQFKEDYYPSNGKIMALNFNLGDHIIEGQKLAIIKKDGSSVDNDNVIAKKSGTVTSVQYSLGAYYDSKKPLISTEDLSYMKALVNLDENDSEYVRLDQKSIISTKFLEFAGKVSYINPSGTINTTDPNKSYLPVEIALNGKVENLKSGMQVKVTIILEEKQNIIAINKNYIKKDMKGTYVYVLSDDDTAHKTYIKTATQFADKLEITEGLKEDDVIILDPNNTIVENQEIVPEESIPANSPLYTE
ncbi:MAG: efflux RND transporter periplasmic adaptor subunit [Oscillospiraceae bacterium]|nr:efflux RND transporter periplasmic adaptor subunit [Oscillospiraceae bacterium]